METRKSSGEASRQRKQSPRRSEGGGPVRFNSADFLVIWNAERKRYEVHGDDGRRHAQSFEKKSMLKAAIRKATRAASLGISAVVRVQQRDGSFKVEWTSGDNS
jgi:hypothetical protein